MSDPNVTTAEVLRAYLDCRKLKRNTSNAISFEMDLSANIGRITRQLRAGTWRPGSSMCFAVVHPKPREIWAAPFADRVVHHVVYNRLRPRIEPDFIPTSFACIPGRGSLYGAKWAHRQMARVTNGWTREAWALQLDVANFFPSISRETLWQLLAPHCPEPWLATATERIVRHDVKMNAHFPGDPEHLQRVPPAKSLWNAPDGLGLPIGNLTSQFGANVYMTGADWFIREQLAPFAYGRYVDDLLLLDTDRAKLLDARDQIAEYFTDHLGLTLHGGKTHLQRVAHGVDFVGWRLLPHRRYLRRRTVGNARTAIAENLEDADALLASVNSYLGIARHGNTYRLRQSLAASAARNPELFSVPNATKLVRRPKCPTSPALNRPPTASLA